nr:MAG: wsv139-like protein [Sesarmops intermedium nimavirus]
MGIPEAGKVYEGTYGVENNRVIKEEEEATDFLEEYTRTATADFSLDLVDLPTFNIAVVTSLGRKIAAKIRSSFAQGSSTNLGQLVLFYNKMTNQITDTLHDENNVLSDDNIAGNTTYSATSGHSMNLVNEFYGKLKNIDRKIVGVKRIRVNIPSSQEEINRLLDPPIEEMMMSPPAGSYNKVDFERVINQWLSKHVNLKPRQFITTAHIINSSSSSFSWKGMYRKAFYASELEGFILLYAHRMLKVLKRVLKSSTNKSGRYAVLFVDGEAPAIKKMARFKRQKRHESTEIKKKKMVAESTPDMKTDALTDMLFHSCERLAVRIPRDIMMCALLDIFKTPLVKTIGAKGLYFSLSSFSEAEDDIVRMISCLLDLETPTKHFSLSERKGLVEYDTYNSYGDKTFSMWSKIISTIKQHTNVDRQKVSVNLFSHDSDVLAKWNLMVAHHNQVCKLLRTSSRDAALSLESCRFFRNKNGSLPDKNSLGGFRRAAPNTVYDLSESPVLLTPESTLLIMLTKGSDYNTSLVSDSTYDVQIRSEVAMFESLTCTCISGWPVFFQTVAQNNITSREDCGNVSKNNMSSDPCSVCGKYLVMPFWSTKFFFAAQAIDFIIGHPKHLYQPPVEIKKSEINKHDIHRALAINAASNVMTYLTMGSFNQRIFGNITCMSKIISSLTKRKRTAAEEKSTLEVTLENIARDKKRKNNNMADAAEPSKKKTTEKLASAPVSKDLSLVVYNSRREFFSNHTEGGIPLLAEPLRSHKKQLFGNVFPPVEENVPETLSGEELKEESEDDDNLDNDWMAKAKRAFAPHNSEFSKRLSSAFKTTNNCVPPPPPPPPPPPRQQQPLIPWNSLVQEFDKCLSRSNLQFTDESILSKISGLLAPPLAHPPTPAHPEPW